MDPLSYLVTQNSLEVSRRNSDDLRIQRNKEAREKEKRGVLDEDEMMASDVHTMSEDLLGDMDPDLFGRGGPTYQNLFEDEEESKPEKPPQEQNENEEDGEGAGSQEDATQPPRLVPQNHVGVEVEVPASVLAAPSLPAAQTGEAVQKKGPPQASESAPNPSPILSSTGLGLTTGLFFDTSHGFLIAEEFQPEETPQAEAEPEKETENVTPELAELLAKLIIGDSSSLSFRRLQALLARFGRGVLRLCLEAGCKVYLLPPGARLQSHPLLADSVTASSMDAAYLAPVRACVFEDICLSRAPYGFQPVLHYFGYAFDHALGGEDFASLRSPAVQASYQASLSATYKIVDSLAGLSPVHYFAQALESYLSENDAIEPICTRADLYDFDRSMFEYIDYLFKRQNKQ